MDRGREVYLRTLSREAFLTALQTADRVFLTNEKGVRVATGVVLDVSNTRFKILREDMPAIPMVFGRYTGEARYTLFGEITQARITPWKRTRRTKDLWVSKRILQQA